MNMHYILNWQDRFSVNYSTSNAHVQIRCLREYEYSYCTRTVQDLEEQKRTTVHTK